MDRISQGRERHPLGEANHLSSLTEDAVLRIRSTEYVPGVYSRLAREMGVTPATIRRAAIGATWKHIPLMR